MSLNVKTILGTKFGFGKFKNKTLQEVLELQPSYVNWCIINVDFFFIQADHLDELIKAGVDLHLSKQAYIKNQEKENALLEEIFEDSRLQAEEDKYDAEQANIRALEDEMVREFYGEEEGETAYWNLD